MRPLRIPGLCTGCGTCIHSCPYSPLKSQYFANLRYPDRASPPENPHKSERSIWVAGIPSCLSPKGRGQPAVRIAT
ncbi:MAG: 4Fe-4S binding protein [Methanoculleus sp.]|uniref:4Fe-4S binding protein n=1 Tax=unclassified Methanoculleus TaxID=2619537 RepID=UPI0025F3F9BD|nr:MULTISPECIES: 4Fe-4S binding protein [unclassified Methanoculleus]MDD4472050.1 4Fe-4S binding protein [Methanoculleus sp.]